MEKENNAKTIIKILAVIFTLIVICVLIVIKVNVPSFPLWQVILYSILFIILCVIIYYGFVFYSKSKVKDKEVDPKLPNAIDIETAKQIAISLVKSKEFADYIPDSLNFRTFNLGKVMKNTIFLYRAMGKYENVEYVVILNLHFPYKLHSVLINPKDEEVFQAMMMLTSNPDDEVATKTTVLENPILGVRKITQEPVKKEEDKKEVKKEDEDI